MLVDAVDIPVVFSSYFEGLIGESVDFLHTETVIREDAEDGSPAGGTTIESEEAVGSHMLFYQEFRELEIY